MRSLLWLPVAAASSLFACATAPTAEDATLPATADTNDVALTASTEPLKSFHYDTGLVPSSGPGQLQLSVLAGGHITVNALGTTNEQGLSGKKGSGKVAVDLHLKLDGKSKVGGDQGDIPGLEDIDVAIKGESAFDPFVTDAKVDANIPATDLPEIPLGATPGKLRLSVVGGSVLHTTFSGTCLTVTGGKATYAGALTTSGRLRLNGKLVVKVLEMEKELDLGDIDVPIPETVSALDFATVDAKGAKDTKIGECHPKPAPTPTSVADTTKDEKPKPTPTPTPTTPTPPGPTEPTTKTVTCTAQTGNYKSLTEVDYVVTADAIQITKLTVRVTNPDGRDSNDVDISVDGKQAFNSGDTLKHDQTIEVPQARMLDLKTGATLKLETNFDRAIVSDPSASCTVSF